MWVERFRMKQLLRRQLTNIVFLVLIVAAALTIYLLSRAQPATAAAQTPAPSASSTPSPTASARQAALGVPESVWQTHLGSSELYTARASNADLRKMALTYAPAKTISAELFYTVSGGCISSIELTFPLLTDRDNQNNIDQYISDMTKEGGDTQTNAVSEMLSDLYPACDAQSRLNVPIIHYWAEQAMLLKKIGDDFEDSSEGFRFLAYRIERDGKEYLVCTLMLD